MPEQQLDGFHIGPLLDHLEAIVRRPLCDEAPPYACVPIQFRDVELQAIAR
jgi:hypothetical protein